MGEYFRTNGAIRIGPALGLDEPGFVVEEPASNARIRVGHPAVFRLLLSLDEWTRREAALADLVDEVGVPREVAGRTFDRLVERGVIVERGSELDRWLSVRDSLEPRGWAAAHEYHLATHDYPFVDMADYDEAAAEETERMQRRKERDPVPDRYRTYPDAESVPLPAFDADRVPEGESHAVLAVTDAGGWIEPSPDGLDLETLADVLFLAFGEIDSHTFPVQGEFLLKTSPSGGSRHPTEAYLLATDVAGLPPGVYHYSVEAHALERLPGGPVDGVVERAAPDRRPAADPATLLVTTAVVERNMWKYREPRTYRVIYYDLGHVLQTLRYCASTFGFGLAHSTFVPEAALLDVLPVDPLAEPITGMALLH